MNFQEYSKYYNLLYKDKDTLTECRYVLRKLDEHTKGSVKNILELGAGSGRHGKIFKENGIRWTGVELSKDMISLGKKMGLNLIQGDISEFELDTKFSAIVSLFHVVSYLNSNDQLNRLFKNVNYHLEPNGCFLFDVWYTPAVYFQKPEDRKKVVEDDEIKIIRYANPRIDWNQNVVEVNYKIHVTNKITSEVHEFTENHPMRHFSIPEIKLLANHNNLEFIEAEEWLTGRTPGVDTWGVTMILRKNG